MDAIGTGWSFPIVVKNAGAASVIGSLGEPFDYTSFPLGGTIFIQFEEGEVQTVSIPQANHSLAAILAYFSGLTDGRATNEGGRLKITSFQDNAARSKITISAPTDLASDDKRDGTGPLGLPKGETFGRGTGSISLTRNPDPLLVTENESIQELKEALLVLMLTSPGERVMLRSYGIGIQDILFEGNNPQVLGVIKYRLTKGTEAWDKRIFPRQIILQRTYDTLAIDAFFEGKTLQSAGTLSLPLPAR